MRAGVAGRIVGAIVLVAVNGCGGEALYPTAPPPPPIPAAARTISGRLVGTQDGLPVAGATLEFTQTTVISATSAADGSFTAGPFADGIVLVTVSSPRHLTRTTKIEVRGSREDIAIDLIATDPPFSLGYYRQLARNGYEAPGALTDLLLWELDLNVYIRTRTEDRGVEVPAYVVSAVAEVIVDSVPELSGGRRRVRRVESGEGPGPTDRGTATGWLTVSFVLDTQLLGGYHGLATYGGPNGEMRLYYQPARNAPPTDANPCVGPAVRIVEHEVMHTMGFYHTDQPSEFFTSGPSCTGRGRPDRVRYHAAIAYRRTMRNADPDADHPSVFQSVASAPSTKWVGCYLH